MVVGRTRARKLVQGGRTGKQRSAAQARALVGSVDSVQCRRAEVCEADKDGGGLSARMPASGGGGVHSVRVAQAHTGKIIPRTFGIRRSLDFRYLR